MSETPEEDVEGRVRDLSCCISLDLPGEVKEFERVGSLRSLSNRNLRKVKI